MNSAPARGDWIRKCGNLPEDGRGEVQDRLRAIPIAAKRSTKPKISTRRRARPGP